MNSMNCREMARQIFLAGVKGVLPGRIIGNLISIRGSLLKIGYLSYDLGKIRNIYVLGAGKASAALGHYMENILGNRITDGFIVTKYGCFCKLKNIKVIEAGHPVSDSNSFKATQEIVRIAEKAGEEDLVICLWSGGGSSLLADYPDNSSHEDIAYLNEILIKCGANIREINAIRKHLSKIKGGQLARHIWPAATVNILLSDVIGDPPDIIVSGPTVPDNSNFADTLKIIEEHQLNDEIPFRLLNYLHEGSQGNQPETPKPDDIVFSKSNTLLAGSNKTALQAAREEAENLNLTTFIVTSELSGDISRVSSSIIETIHNYRNNTSLKKPVCLLFGGETTVRVTGNGLGGRNQHLALTVATLIRDIPGITFLSAGTDGNDGDTEIAGAVVDSGTFQNALSLGTDPDKYLTTFDSYHFFKSAGGHIYTGPTFTNVMDLAVVIIE